MNRPGYVTLALLPGITHARPGHVALGGKEIPVAWRSGQWGRFFPLRAGDTAILQVPPASVFETGACAVMRGDLLDSRMTLVFCQYVIKGPEPWTQP